MRVVVQRVLSASVEVDKKVVGEIGEGALLLLGISKDDTENDVAYIVDKVVNLRVFEDDVGRMNKSLKDIKGELLVVSQFTLYGDCRKGRRPSYDKAAKSSKARHLYDFFIEEIRKHGNKVETGMFGKEMKVGLINHGPVTLLLDSSKSF